MRHADGAKERAHRAGRDIAALAVAGLGVSELHTAAIRLIGDLECSRFY
ncbi:MAG TPA: hypothetical protein VE155_11210 [Pseudonocardiaceae bacterium]|nr:hypothetical protein [Pseudonocardiaceae bacterium]